MPPAYDKAPRKRARKPKVASAPSGRPKGARPPGHAGQSPSVKHYAKGPPKPRVKKVTDARSPDRRMGDGTGPVYAQRVHRGKVVGNRRFINADSFRHYEDRLEHKAKKRVEAHANAEQEAKLTTAIIPKASKAAARDVAKAHERELMKQPGDHTPEEAKASGQEYARSIYAVPRDPDDPVRRKRVRKSVKMAEKRILKENEAEKAVHEDAERKHVVPAGTSDAAAIAANRKARDKTNQRKLVRKVKGDISDKRRKGGVGRWLENAKDDVVDTVTGAPASAAELAKVAAEQSMVVGHSIHAATHPGRREARADTKHTKALVKGVKESDPAYALLTGHPKEALMRIKERPVSGIAEFVPATAVLGKGARVVKSTAVARKTGETRQAVASGQKAAKHARPALRTETAPRARAKTKAQRKAMRRQVKQTAQRTREAARAQGQGRAAPAPSQPGAKPRQHSPNIVVRSTAKAKDRAVAATGRDPNVAPKARRFGTAQRATDRKLNVAVRNIQAAGIGNEERVVTHAHKALPRNKRKSRAHRAAVQLLVDASIRPGHEVEDLAAVEREVRLHGGEHDADNLDVLRRLRQEPDILKDPDVRKAAKSLAAESQEGDARSVAAGYAEADTLEHARRTRGALRRGEIRERPKEERAGPPKKGGRATPPSKPPKRDVLAEARADVPKHEPEVAAMAEQTGGSAPSQGEGRRPESAAAKAENRAAALRARAESEVADVATTGHRHAEGGSGVVDVKHTAPVARKGGTGRATVAAKLKAHQVELRNHRRNSKVVDEFVETTQAVVRLRGEIQGAPDTNATRIKKARLGTWEARRAELAKHEAVKKYVEGKKKERDLQAELDALPREQNIPAHEATIGGDTNRPIEAIKLVGKPDVHGNVPAKPDPGRLPAGQPGPTRGAEAESREVEMIDGKPHVKRNGKWVRLRPTARKTGEVMEPTPESTPRQTEEDIATARASAGPWTPSDQRRLDGLEEVRHDLSDRVEEALRDGDDQLAAKLDRDLTHASDEIDRLAERKPAAQRDPATPAGSSTHATAPAAARSQSSPVATEPRSAANAEKLPEPEPVKRAIKSLTPDVKVEPEADAGVKELAADFAKSDARFEFEDGTPVTLPELRARHIGDKAGYVRGAKLEKSDRRTLGAPESGDIFNVDDLFQPLGTGRVGATALEREQRITLANLTRTVRDEHAYREGKHVWSSTSAADAAKKGAELSKQSGVDYGALAIKRPGGGVEYVLMPRFLTRRISGQLRADGRIMRGARWGTRIAVRATLPFSVLWHAGNAIDLMTRLALTTPPGSIGEGRALHAALEKQLQTLSPDLRAHVLDSLKGHFGSRQTVRDPRFADVLRDSRLEPIGKVTNALGDALKATGGRAVDALFDFSSEIERHLVNRAIGTEAKKYARDLGIEVKDNVNAMRDLAGHLERDPAKVVELQDRILEIVGDFSTRSATDRKILAGIDPYWNWMKAATKFVLRTLPEKHPKRTALLFIAAGLTDEERAKSGLNYYFDEGELDKLRRDLDYSSQRTGFMSGSIGPQGEGIPTVPLTSFGEVANLLTQPATLAGRPLSYIGRPAAAAAGYLRTPGEVALKALPGGGEASDLRHYSDSFDRAAQMGSESILPGGRQIRQVREGGVAPKRDSTFWDPSTVKGRRTPLGGVNTVVNFARSQATHDKKLSVKELDKRTPKVPVGQEFTITYDDELGNPRTLRVKRTH